MSLIDGMYWENLDGEEENSPITHGDQIRAMTNEELSVWLAENCGCGDWCMHNRSGVCGNENEPENYCCINVWFDWLKSPVEVDDA